MTALINHIRMVVQTATSPDWAGTTNDLTLNINTRAGSLWLSTKDQQNPNTLITLGGAAVFTWGPMEVNILISANDIQTMILEISGDDAWLPALIQVSGKTDDGTVALVNCWTWPSTDCFSTDTKACQNAKAQHELSLLPQ